MTIFYGEILARVFLQYVGLMLLLKMTRRNFAVIFDEKKSDDVCHYFARIKECDGQTELQ